MISDPRKAVEFRDELERDFALRSLGQLQVTNLRGSVTIQGWVMDKIRVKAVRKAIAESPEDAKRLFSALDFRFRASGADIELSAEYGRGLEIHERLRERTNPRTSMDMIVYAPANLKLSVWAVDGEVVVRGWNAPLEVRTTQGDVRASDLKSKVVSVLCPSCSIRVHGVDGGSVRCMGGSGDVEIEDVRGSQIFVETSSGAQKLSRISGEQLYLSKTGPISGRDLRGQIEFQSQRGAVDIQEAAGFASGRTEFSNIRLKMREWSFADKALIESSKGSIFLSLPTTFAGEIDVWSVFGKTRFGFPLQALSESRVYGPEPANHFRGRVGEGGEQLKVFSQEGDVQVLRGT